MKLKGLQQKQLIIVTTLVIRLNKLVIANLFSRMQSSSTKFFNTEIQLRTSGPHPYPHNYPHSHNQPQSSNSILSRLSQLKQHRRQASQLHRRALSSKIHTQKSIDSMHKTTQKIRISFLKLYENKKQKLINNRSLQAHLLSKQQNSFDLHQKISQKHLDSQNSLLNLKSELQQQHLSLQIQNKKQKQKLRKQMKIKANLAYDFAREQYQKGRAEKEVVQQRNRKIKEILEMRSQINYVEKIQKQMEIIRMYEAMLKEVEGADLNGFEDLIRPVTGCEGRIEKGEFFVTEGFCQDGHAKRRGRNRVNWTKQKLGTGQTRGDTRGQTRNQKRQKQQSVISQTAR